MTQQKKGSKVKSSINLVRDKFLSLPQNEQISITHFLNLHNAASFLYDELSDEGKMYIEYIISLNAKVENANKKDSAQE